MAERESLFVSTSPGLEPALLAECRALDPGARVERGGVSLSGAPGLHQEACLRLRTASHVLLRLGAAAPGELGRISLARVWDGRSPVQLSGPANLERAARAAWRTPPPSGGGAGGGVRLLLRQEGGRVEVSADASGPELYRRGYRQEVSRAPLRETLAAGLLALAGHDPALPLWDPMCGSGTIAIEGAWRALSRAPGTRRDAPLAFESWPGFDRADWEARLAQARSEERATLPAPILASDLNAGSLGTARRNARRAGLEGMLRLERHDATRPRPLPTPPGLVVANLPYGIRVGEAVDLPALCRGLGAALRQGAPGWRFGLLVADAALERDLGLSVDARHPVENGGIPCVLLCGRVQASV